MGRKANPPPLLLGVKIGTFARETAQSFIKKTKRRSNIDPETLYNRKKIMYCQGPAPVDPGNSKRGRRL